MKLNPCLTWEMGQGGDERQVQEPNRQWQCETQILWQAEDIWREDGKSMERQCGDQPLQKSIKQQLFIKYHAGSEEYWERVLFLKKKITVH